MSTFRILFGLALVSAAALAAGCGGPPKGSVGGKVIYKGNPVAKAQVNFFMKEKGQGAIANTDETGQFQFDTALETGTYAVFVTPLPPEPGNPAAGPVKKTVTELPRKYQDLTTSDLTFTVKPGKNDCPLDLGK